MPITVDLRGLSEKMNPHFKKLVLDTHPLQVLIGGANSSKSYSIAQKIIYKTLLSKKSRWLACRKVKKDVKHSIFDTLREVISDWDMDNLFSFNNTESYIQCKLQGSDILGVGLDDVNKLKSILNPTNFWVDEADQITRKDLAQLRIRLRASKQKLITDIPEVLQGIVSMNPININHWIKTELIDNIKSDTLYHHSTYKDNLFLDKQVIDYLESIDDPYYKDVYVLGNWGIYGNTVFSKYIIEDFDYTEDDLENVATGMDFGTVHASTIERIGWKDNELYFFDELYGKGWTNPDFIQAAEDYWENQIGHEWNITADSAEPDRIIEWQRAGWRNINPAKKGAGSLKYGIDFLAARVIHVHKTKCPNLARELQQFKRKEDKDGTVTEAFVEINDDCIAASRYATEYMHNPNYVMNIDSIGVTADDLGF